MRLDALAGVGMLLEAEKNDRYTAARVNALITSDAERVAITKFIETEDPLKAIEAQTVQIGDRVFKMTKAEVADTDNPFAMALSEVTPERSKSLNRFAEEGGRIGFGNLPFGIEVPANGITFEEGKATMSYTTLVTDDSEPASGEVVISTAALEAAFRGDLKNYAFLNLLRTSGLKTDNIGGDGADENVIRVGFGDGPVKAITSPKATPVAVNPFGTTTENIFGTPPQKNPFGTPSDGTDNFDIAGLATVEPKKNTLDSAFARQAKTNLNASETTLSELAAELLATIDEKLDLEAKLAATRERLGAAKKLKAELEATLAGLQAQIAEQATILAEQDAILAKQEVILAEQDATLARLQHESENLDKQIAQADSEIAGWNEVIRIINADSKVTQANTNTAKDG